MRIKRMGEAYSAGDVITTTALVQDMNPSELNYGYTYAHEHEYGIKRDPRAWRMGKKSFEASMTLPLDVSAEFEKIAPGGDIAKLRPFVMVVVFFNAENEMIRDIITWKFTGNKRNVSGDAGLENQFEMFITDLELNKRD